MVLMTSRRRTRKTFLVVLVLLASFTACPTVPGTKFRSRRRRKTWPRGLAARKGKLPRDAPSSASGVTSTATASVSSPSTSTSGGSGPVSASHKKLSLSPYLGRDSWCKWQVAQATGDVYDHQEPLPDSIVQLLRPIYARLGSRSLLEKCVQGYTQNENEALHSTVWKFCPKELFMGKTGVETACAVAVCCFNDRSSSLTAISDRLQLSPSPLSKSFQA